MGDRPPDPRILTPLKAALIASLEDSTIGQTPYVRRSRSTVVGCPAYRLDLLE